MMPMYIDQGNILQYRRTFTTYSCSKIYYLYLLQTVVSHVYAISFVLAFICLTSCSDDEYMKHLEMMQIAVYTLKYWPKFVILKNLSA